MAELSIQKLTKSFGGPMAVSNVSLEIKNGELVGLIGPNGAGKTTVFNLLTGIYEPTSGEITSEHDDRKTTEQAQTLQDKQGRIARTFQNIRLFRDLTVLDNVRIAIRMPDTAFWPGFCTCRPMPLEEKKIVEEKHKSLDIFNLSDKKNEMARNLPYGEQRRLEIVAPRPALRPAAGRTGGRHEPGRNGAAYRNDSAAGLST